MPIEPARFPRYARILGIKVHDVNQQSALRWILKLLDSGQEHMVVTPSSLMVEMADRDPDLKRILNSASLSLPDGAGLLWAARMLGDHLTRRTTGCDLVVPLAREMQQRSLAMFLLGGKPGVAEAATETLTELAPGLSIAGTHHGYFSDDDKSGAGSETSRVLEIIRKAGPQVLLVGMGVPRQEKWMAAHHREIGVPLCIGVGGTLDVLAGTVIRAPRWVGAAGLEWLYRALQEPKRFLRLRQLPRFVFRVLVEKAAGHRNGKTS